MKATKGIILSVQLSMGIAFLMTQGCITAKPEGKKTISGHHKGPFGYYPARHSKADAQVSSYQDDLMSSTDSFDDGSIVGSQSQGPSTYTPPVNKVATQSEVYIVKKGDILSRLAVRFHTTTKELTSLNNLSNPNTLYVGQELHIPASNSSYSSKGSSSSSAEKGQKYEIRKGDTLSRIAVAANVSIDELRSVNNIKNDRIFAGEIIYIPKGGKLPSHRKSQAPKKTLPTIKAPEALAPTDTTSTSSYTAPPPLAPLEPVQEVVVEAGDSLALIAKRNNTTKAEIMRLNGITDETAIRNGQRLHVPIQK